MESLFARHRWLMPVACVGLALLLLQAAVAPIGDPTTGLDGSDFTGNFYPLYGYTADQVARGELPLWNPYQFIGFPVAGNPQAAIFYPPTWVIWLATGAGLPLAKVMGAMVMAHVALSAGGAAAFTRQSGATYTAALLAGVIYAMSGWVGARIYAGHYTILTVMAWMPWVFTGYQRALCHRTIRSLFLPTAALGMAALAGHPQMVLYTVIGMVVILVVASYQSDEGIAAFGTGVLRLGIIGLGAILLGAALLLPTAELVQFSARTDTDRGFVNSFALAPSQLVTLMFPFFYGNPRVEPYYYWGHDFFEELTAYAGLFPLMALVIVAQLRDQRAWLWITFAVVGFVLSIGADGVIYALLVQWVPGFSLFRSPGRFLYFVMLGMAGATALVFTHMQQVPGDRRREILEPLVWLLPYGVLAAFVLSVLFGGWFASASHVEPMPHRAEQIAGVLGYTGLMLLALYGILRMLRSDQPRTVNLALILLAAFVIVDAWRAVLPVVTTSAVTERPLWEGAVINVPTDDSGRVRAYADPNNYYPNAVNNASLTRHQHVLGYDPLAISVYDQFLKDAGDDPNNALYGLIGLRYLLTWEPREDQGWQLIGIADGGIYYERERTLPRAWVVNEGVLESDDAAARELILSETINPRRTVILDQPLECSLGKDPDTVTITRYHPNNVAIRVSGDGGVLVLSDQFYPGWVAIIDGQPVDIRRAYTMLRAVCVPPGDHMVEFLYRPRSVFVGALISLISWVILGITWGLVSLIAGDYQAAEQSGT